MIVSLAHAAGATVWGQTGSEHKAAAIIEQGAERAIVAGPDDLGDQIAELEPTVVFDPLGGGFVAPVVAATATRGGGLVRHLGRRRGHLRHGAAVSQDDQPARLRRHAAAAGGAPPRARGGTPGARGRLAAGRIDSVLPLEDVNEAFKRLNSAPSRATCCSTSASAQVRPRPSGNRPSRAPAATGWTAAPVAGWFVEADRREVVRRVGVKQRREVLSLAASRTELELAAPVGADTALGAVVVGVAQLLQAADPRRLDVDHPGRERQRLDVVDRVDRGVPCDPVVDPRERGGGLRRDRRRDPRARRRGRLRPLAGRAADRVAGRRSCRGTAP